jgi:hypothetical protein
VDATTVIVNINGQQIAKGHFSHGDIDQLFAPLDKAATDLQSAVPKWEGAIYGIVAATERGENLNPKAVMATALWAACRRGDDPEGAQAIEDIARQGGNTISVEIKTDAEGFEFRGRGYPTPRVVSREQTRRLRQMQKQRPDPEPAA